MAHHNTLFLYAVFVLLTVAAYPSHSNEVLPVSCADKTLAAAKRLEANHKQALASAKGAKHIPTQIKALLTDMETADQKIRLLYLDALQSCGLEPEDRKLGELVAAAHRIDNKNLDQLKVIVNETGWPVISTYGEDADRTAFLVAQHADRDIAFQGQILSLLTELVIKKETNPENYALLYDRVLTNQGKSQWFGSQGECKGSEWIPVPIEASIDVDARRAAYGLEPLREYAKRAAEMGCSGTPAPQ